MKHRSMGSCWRLSVAALVLGVVSAAPASAKPPGLHVVPSPVVAGSALSGAAVVASNDMWSVGRIASASGQSRTLAEHFDGTSWTIAPTPSIDASLAGVDGAAGNDVWAVGDQAAGNSVTTLIEHGCGRFRQRRLGGRAPAPRAIH